MNEFSPFLAIIYFAYFYKNNHLNHVLTGFIFVSFLFFATNYSNFGLNLSFDIFRTLHRFIGFICSLLVVIHIFRCRINVFKHEVARLLGLFFLVLIISSIANDLDIGSFIHYVRNFVFISLVVLFLYFKIVSKEQLDELFIIIVHLTLILALFAIVDHFVIGTDRVSLFYSNPNYLAFSLLPGLSISFFLKHKLKFFFVFLILLAILFTGSRAVILSSVLVMGIYLISVIRSYDTKIVFLASALTLCGVFSCHFIGNDFFKKTTNSTRVGMIHLAANVINSSPLNGIGYGQFRKSFHLFVDQELIDMESNEIIDNYYSHQGLSDHEKRVLNIVGIPHNSELMTHSDLLTVICELGLVGVMFLIYFFYKLYLELKKLFLFSDRLFLLSISLISSVLCFSLFHNNMTAFVFWFVLFLPFIMNRNYKANDSL